MFALIGKYSPSSVTFQCWEAQRAQTYNVAREYMLFVLNRKPRWRTTIELQSAHWESLLTERQQMSLSITVRRNCGSKEAFPGHYKAVTQTALANYTGVLSMWDTHLKGFRELREWHANVTFCWSVSTALRTVQPVYWTRRHFILTPLPYRRACLKTNKQTITTITKN